MTTETRTREQALPRDAGGEIRLISMTLANFKGVRGLRFTPQGADTSVFGRNGTGKTSLADGFSWLVTGKDSAGRTDFDLLPLGPDGKRVPEVTEASVEAVLEIDGRQVTLKKTYREVWTKKRGRPAPEYTGNTVDYWIDGVPKKAGEYAAYIKGLADEERLRIITNPRAFHELPWQKRRGIIMTLDGNVTDADVVASDPALAELSYALKGRNIEDHRKVIDAEIKKTNQELDKLPVRIDEAGRSLPEPLALPGDLEAMRKSRAEKAALAAQMDAGGLIAGKVKALREIEGQIVDLDNKHREKQGHEVSAARAMVDEAKSEVKGIERDLEAMGKTATDYLNEIKGHEAKVQELASAWEAAQDKTFQHEDVTTCYACGQSLPEAAVKAAHDRALAVFNAAKSSEIEQIETAGKAKQETLKSLREKLAKVQRGIDDGFKLLEKARGDLTVAENKLTAINSSVTTTVSLDPRRHQLADQQLGLQSEIEELKKGAVNPAKDKLAGEITLLDSLIEETEKAAANNERRQTVLKRIEELKAQQKDLGKTYESLEHQRELCERFVVTKAQMLNDRIDGKFKLAKWKLFEVQINGAVNDQMCEAMLDGRPYSSLSNGEQIMVGTDIVETLCTAWGLRAPVFIDNRESLTLPLTLTSQTISLIVREEDEKLRVEAK